MRRWPRAGARRLATALAALAARAGLATAQDAAPPSAAILFGYRPHAGMEGRFHEGYRRHLEWHRAKRDSLVWYGWEVLIGDRPGVFIDGTFGRPFLAFDERVEPAADGADFEATAGAFAAPLFRTAYLLLRDLSTGTPLERGHPTAMLEVITYRVRPGMESRFESAALAATRAAARDAPPFTWYRLVNGGPLATYLLTVHRQGLGGWDRHPADLASQLARIPAPRGPDLLASLSEAVVEATSEAWRYLPRSSLIPGAERR